MLAVKDRRVPSPHLTVTGRRKLGIVGISPFVNFVPLSLLVSPWATPKTPDRIFAPYTFESLVNAAADEFTRSDHPTGCMISLGRDSAFSEVWVLGLSLICSNRSHIKYIHHVRTHPF